MRNLYNANKCTLESSGPFAVFGEKHYVVSRGSTAETYLIFSDVHEPGFSPRNYGKEGYSREVRKDEIKYGYALKSIASYGEIDCAVISYNRTSDCVTVQTFEPINESSIKNDIDTYITKIQLHDAKLRITPFETQAFDLRTKEEYKNSKIQALAPDLVHFRSVIDGVIKATEKEVSYLVAYQNMLQGYSVSTESTEIQSKVERIRDKYNHVVVQQGDILQHLILANN